MNNYTARVYKVLIGTLLIGLTLAADSEEVSTTLLYPLVAVPFVMAGIFDWRPLEFVVMKVATWFRPTASDIQLMSKNA